MNGPTCPADASHGEMVELYNSDIYYCYDCKWVNESRHKLERFMLLRGLRHDNKKMVAKI